VPDLRSFAVGRCGCAPVVDDDGLLINDPVVLRLAADRFWFSVADSDVVLLAGGIARGLGLDVAVSEPDVWPLAVQGPRAEDVAAAVFGEQVRAVKFFRFAQMAAYLGSGKNSPVFTIVSFRARSIAATRGCETPRRSARHRKGPDPGFWGPGRRSATLRRGRNSLRLCR
jgi:hypothetical protein